MTSPPTVARPIGLYIPFASGSLADEAVIQGTVGFGDAVGRPARVHLHNSRRRWRCDGAEDHYVHHRRLTGISRRDIRRALRAGRPTHVLILMNDTFDGQWGISHTHYALTVGHVAVEEGIRPIICNISVQDEPLQPFVDAVRGLSPDIHVVARDVRSAATLSRLLERSVDAIPDIATFMRPAFREQRGRDEHEVILVPNQHQSALFDHIGDVADRYTMIADALAGAGFAVRVMPHDLRSHVGDERLAVDVVARAASPAITFYRPASTAEAKGSIASAGALVAGRLHACLAGLSTGTPTVGLGYMGKFEMQFAWFQVEANVLDLRYLRSASDVAEQLLPLFENVPQPVSLEDYRPLVDLVTSTG